MIECSYAVFDKSGNFSNLLLLYKTELTIFTLN